MLSSSRQDRSRAERVSCDLSRSKVRDLILKISNRLFRGTCVKSEEISPKPGDIYTFQTTVMYLSAI